MTQSDFDAFVNQVDEMMEAQREYFRHRRGPDLERSKALEREVRKRIQEIKAARDGRGQATMFDT